MHIYIYRYRTICAKFQSSELSCLEYWILCCRTFPMDMSNCETKVHNYCGDTVGCRNCVVKNVLAVESCDCDGHTAGFVYG